MNSLSDTTKTHNKIHFFSKLDENSLQALQQKLRSVMSPTGEELGREGDRSVNMFILASGSLAAIKKGNNGHPVEMNTPHAGQVAGKMSLLGDMNILKAEEETGVWVLDRDEFQNIFEIYAASGNALLVVIADHLDQEKSIGAKLLSQDLGSRPRIVAIAFFDTKPSMRAACEKGNNTRYNIVVDRATGLMRQNTSGVKSGFNANLTPEDVQAYITRLNQERFAGYDNWRLPTIEELRSLFKPEAQSQGLYINPGFDATWTWNWCGNADQDESGAEWDVAFDVAA